MKVTTKLAQLRANSGNISYEEISESTGINPQQLRELENGEAIAFTTLAQLCAFFHCSPNDLLVVDWEGEEIAPPTAEEIEKASQIIKQAFARAEAMPPVRRKFGIVLKGLSSEFHRDNSPLIFQFM
ncbi:MAG: helix-turn-helix transcriptional regulator [Moorea sp. SIO3G5]|nr:helix-turn-helix transcriptional regulator [Moorena sp. SIO3G5]